MLSQVAWLEARADRKKKTASRLWIFRFGNVTLSWDIFHVEHLSCHKHAFLTSLLHKHAHIVIEIHNELPTRGCVPCVVVVRWCLPKLQPWREHRNYIRERVIDDKCESERKCVNMIEMPKLSLSFSLSLFLFLFLSFSLSLFLSLSLYLSIYLSRFICMCLFLHPCTTHTHTHTLLS